MMLAMMGRSILIFTLGGGLLPALLQGAAATHPRLVDPATTDCTECHDDLVADRGNVHSPVADDCTTCHEFTLAEQKTEVRLMEEGTALCLVCHDELTAAAELEYSHAPVSDDCVLCHDPHASSQEALLSGPVTELCASCHDLEELAARHGGQLVADTRCQACHQPHGSQNPRLLLGRRAHAPFADGSCQGCHREPFADRIRLRTRGERLCVACHGNLAPKEAAGGSRHAALTGSRGRAGCLACHDPHMSANRGLLHVAGPAGCGECHQALVAAATAKGGHAPAAEDCLTCHRPHLAAQHKLLNEPAGELCAMCHELTDAELTAGHLGADLSALACISCHDPHGSEHGKLLARYLHAPLADGCDLCHDGAVDQLVDALPDLCVMCHEDVGEVAAKAPVTHAALELGSCVDCHNPHASAQERLIKQPGGGACLECHDDMGPEEGELAHGAIALYGCRTCHEPHGGKNAKLLRVPASDLCLACHDPRRHRGDQDPVQLLGRFPVSRRQWQAMASLRLSPDGQRNHPNTNHRVLGVPTAEELRRADTTWTEELTCLSCHNPHKGRYRLLNWGAPSAMAACINCHEK